MLPGVPFGGTAWASARGRGLLLAPALPGSFQAVPLQAAASGLGHSAGPAPTLPPAVPRCDFRGRFPSAPGPVLSVVPLPSRCRGLGRGAQSAGFQGGIEVPRGLFSDAPFFREDKLCAPSVTWLLSRAAP